MIGNPVTLVGGAGGGGVVGVVWATLNAFSDIIIGSTQASTLNFGGADGEYFTYSEGVFTCQVPGTYAITYWGRANNTTGGSAVTLTYKFSTDGSASTMNYNGGTGTKTVTLGLGDTFSASAHMSGSQSSIRCDFGYYIEVAA